MIKRIKYKNKLNKPIDCVMEVIENDKKFIYCKRLEDNEPVLIDRKDIIEISEAKIEHKK